jgi:hypothetical protein
MTWIYYFLRSNFRASTVADCNATGEAVTAGVLAGTAGAGVAGGLVAVPFLSSSSSSQPPNQPGCLQLVVVVVVVVTMTPEVVPGGIGRVLVIVVAMVVVSESGSLQPNQPGSLHMVVV